MIGYTLSKGKYSESIILKFTTEVVLRTFYHYSSRSRISDSSPDELSQIYTTRIVLARRKIFWDFSGPKICYFLDRERQLVCAEFI